MNNYQLLIALTSTILMFFSFKQTTQTQEITNPLPGCPASPNCAVDEFTFRTDSATLLNAADAAFREMKAQSIEWKTDSTQIHAVFKIPLFGYLDDVKVATVTKGSETKLFVRSASREGYYDLGVNNRRVKKFIKNINKHISN